MQDKETTSQGCGREPGAKNVGILGQESREDGLVQDGEVVGEALMYEQELGRRVGRNKLQVVCTM